MSALFICLSVGLLPATGVCCYYLLLALVGLAPGSPSRKQATGDETRFAIIIPAHDEELVLGETLRSCLALKYPPERFKVFVVADNCSDRTADIPASYGATCLERSDPRCRGKGYALEYAFRQLLSHQEYQGLVVLDADCRISADALQVFDRYLAEGEVVLQARISNSNPDESPISYAASIGKVLEDRFFCVPKARLGLPVFLRGTGMVFHRDVLEQVPWEAFSVVEDREYSVRLLRAGFSVRYVEDARVMCLAPVGKQQMGVQRVRWAAGIFGGRNLQAFGLIAEGIRTRSISLIDAGWTMLVLSRPLVLLMVLVTACLCFVGALHLPMPHSAIILGASGFLVLSQVVCLALGAWTLGLTRRRLALFAQSPWVIARLAIFSILGFMSSRRAVWVRTPRSASVREQTAVGPG